MIPDRFYVYGTLRPGYNNARCWQGLARPLHDGEATLGGFELRSWHGGFPYAVPAESGAVITGAVILPYEGCYDEVLANLDMLESYPHHYDRWIVEVDTPDGPMTCWMYVPPERAWKGLRAELPLVRGGDWRREFPPRPLIWTR